MPRPHYKSDKARLPRCIGGGVGLGGPRLSVSCIIIGQERRDAYAIDARLLGQMIACATMTDSPLKVALGEPYSR